MSIRSFTWSTRRDGNSGYVLERVPGTGYAQEFGPLPCHAVLSWVEARRKFIALRMKEIGATEVTLDLLDTLH